MKEHCMSGVNKRLDAADKAWHATRNGRDSRARALWKIWMMLAICPLIRHPVSAQSVTAYALYNASGTSPAQALGNSVDSITNSYLLAGFSSATTINGTTLNNAGGWPNIFLMKFKYGTTSAPQWSKAPVTDYTITNAGIGSDASGNSYVAGSFGGTNLTFATTTLTNRATTLDHSKDIFLVKYDNSGNFKFLTQAGGTDDDALGGLATDTSGNNYLTGVFQSSTFSAGSSNLIRQSTSGGDCFIIKYNSSGSVAWIEQGSYASGNCIAFDTANNCYVGGTVLGPAVFDGLNPSNQITTNFLAKYDSAGTLQWVRGDITVGKYLKVDGSGNIYTVGAFSNILQIGSITLTNSAASTIFSAEYDSTGAVLWATQLPGLGNDIATGLVIDNHANCWISGYFASTSSPTNTVAIVARYDQGGNLTARSQVDPSHGSMIGGIASGGGGPGANVWVAGSYSTNFALGSKLSAKNSGNLDLFSAWVMISPLLAVTTSSTNIVSSWSAADSPGYVLESSSDVTSTSWSSLGGGTTVNGQKVVTNAISSGVHFYRLRKP